METEQTIIHKILLRQLIQKAKEIEIGVSKNYVATNKILNPFEIRRLAREKKSIAFIRGNYKNINSAAFYNSMRFNTIMEKIEDGTLYYTKRKEE